MKVRYTTPEGEEIIIDFYTQLLDYGKPKKEMQELPAEYAFIGVIAANLMAHARQLEDEMEVWWAEEDDALRDAGEKGEANIKNQIKRNPRWAKKRRKINRAWAEYMKVSKILDAFGLKYGVLDRRESNSEKIIRDEYLPSFLRRMKELGQPTKGKLVRRIPKASKKQAKLRTQED